LVLLGEQTVFPIKQGKSLFRMLRTLPKPAKRSTADPSIGEFPASLQLSRPEEEKAIDPADEKPKSG